MVEIIIARHGNTFEKDETPRRVGSKTDIPLVGTGFLQAAEIGLHLQRTHWKPSLVVQGPLLRHKQTASGIVTATGWPLNLQLDTSLDEIDYGVDENKTDADVNARLGEDALKLWDKNGIVPEGWKVDVDAMRASWKKLFEKLEAAKHKRVLIVTSNGTARFVLSILENDPQEFLKLGTGKLGYITLDDGKYTLQRWNVDPKESTTLNF